MKITLKGKQFTIHWGVPDRGFSAVLGGCESRRLKRPRIFLTEVPPTQTCLNTEIHEMIHGWFDAKMTEREVRHLSNDLSRALWRMGYRKQIKEPTE